MADNIELTEEKYSAMREEMLSWLYVNGFMLEEDGKKIKCMAQTDPDAYILLDESFQIIEAGGAMAQKKKKVYMQGLINKQMQVALVNI